MRRQMGAGCDVIARLDWRQGARYHDTTGHPEETSPEAGIPTDRNSVPMTTPRLQISYSLSSSRRSTTNGLTWP